jgi:hypothetical protein
MEAQKTWNSQDNTKQKRAITGGIRMPNFKLN